MIKPSSSPLRRARISTNAAGRIARLALIGLLLGLFNNDTAQAATFVVSNTADSGAGSLRAAITAANNAAGADTINCSVTGTINLASALPDLSGSLTLNGPVSGKLTVRRGAGGDYRIFHVVAGASVAISRLNIANGRVSGVFPDNAGGGIYNAGTLTISNSTLSGNSASGQGGGIYNVGTLTVSNSTLANNGVESLGNGGGIHNAGQLSLLNSTVAGNSAGFLGNGGGIHNAATATVGSTLIALNSVILSSGPDAHGSFTSQGYNLIGQRDGGNGFTHNTDQSGTTASPLDPHVALDAGQKPLLADNGGPTPTVVLLGGSPAIDKGRDFAGTHQDQRGQPRPFNDPNIANASGGDDSDIGAFELQAALPPTNLAPVNLSISPSSGSSLVGNARLFTSTYSDPEGANTINSAYLRVGSTNANSLLGYYSAVNNKFYLLNDAGTTFLPGFAPGTANTISNSQGSLNCANSTVTKVGTTLTITWSFTPNTTWAGTTQKLFLFARDRAGLSDGYDHRGTWTITSSANVAPVNVSLSPSSGSSVLGAARLFTAVYSDANGAGTLERVYLRIGSRNANSLLGYYSVLDNKLYLLNDVGTAFIGGFTPGTSNIISNSQGRLNCATTTVTQSGNALTVRWSFTPTGTWAGTTQNLYLYARDGGRLFDGYDLLGTWTITSN